MSTAITLPVGATAEPDTCGSCRFFVRMGDLRPIGQGRCNITLPPVLATKYDFRTSENSYQFDLITDDKRCDLQRPDGKIYIVQRCIGKTT
jgi:hypothetical protein